MKDDTKAILAFIAVCIVWGSTYLAIRIGVSEVQPFIFAGIRFTLAGSLMLLYAKIKTLEFPKSKRDVLNITIVGLFLLLGGHGLVVWTEQWVASSIASILVATVPLFIAIIELFVPNGSRLTLKGWIGLILGFIGVVFLTFTDSSSAIDVKGAILLLLASLLWAVGSVYQNTFKATGSTVSHIGIEMVVGGISLLIVGLLYGNINLDITLKGISALLYLIVFGSLIGYSSYIYILQKWPPSKAGTYAYINPIVAVILGALILNEAINLRIIISTFIILIGVVLVQTSKNKTEGKETWND
ncbi:EamA family transporter [Caloramator australicus]|uniref:Permease of the drug/metabolite transporter (DMT) superfamily n=1 Tax=Caloramator australicus RC3 TaxID=857293 RepID=I7J4W5_9CLOT|nr:EamA family transporter [Caloramator australicus]CCJ33146.1 Permease of the drug/metabolite transporter (DMT) superfamily [Caloramator australicus RC3]